LASFALSLEAALLQQASLSAAGPPIFFSRVELPLPSCLQIETKGAVELHGGHIVALSAHICAAGMNQAQKATTSKDTMLHPALDAL
jgi:hypothetical protein